MEIVSGPTGPTVVTGQDDNRRGLTSAEVALVQSGKADASDAVTNAQLNARLDSIVAGQTASALAVANAETARLRDISAKAQYDALTALIMARTTAHV